MWYCAVLTSGYCRAIAAKRSSQYGMLWMMPFDLVAEVTWRRGRVRASSNAKRITRSQPFRVKTDCWTASSSSVSR